MLVIERGRRPRRSRIDVPRGPRTRGGDPAVLLAVAVLAALGLLNLSALGERDAALRQGLAVAAGLVVFGLARFVPRTSLRRLGWACYAVSLVLLVAVLGLGSAAYGARRWIEVGGFTVQPSEFAKAGLVLALANVLTGDLPWRRRLPLALLVAAAPISLVVIEPDLSTALLLTGTTAVLLVLGRVPVAALAGLVAVSAAAVPLLARSLHSYQVERLRSFLSGGSTGAGWTVTQAHYAVAWNGDVRSTGPALRRAIAAYLPARETDLAFASLVEQWGIVAGLAAVVAAGVLVWRAAATARRAPTRQAEVVAAGLAVLIGVEAVVSVAANLGLLPTAGVPFPLLSYGGNAAAVHIGLIGLVLAQRADAARRPLWSAPVRTARRPRLVRVTALALVGSLVTMGSVAVHLQRSAGAQLRAEAVQQMTRCFAVPAARGAITDRHGVPIAVDVERTDVVAVRGLLTSTAGRRLSTLLGGSRAVRAHIAAAAVPAFRAGTVFAPIATVAAPTATRLRGAGLAGVLLVADPRRLYRYGALLGPVLGWTGIATPDSLRRWPQLTPLDVVGRAGLEQQYDPELRGTDGRQCVYVTPTGNGAAVSPLTPPVPGRPLRLSLDLGLQRTLDAELQAALRRAPGRNREGSAVAMDPRNGQVLAMASRPSYDDNLFTPPMNTRALTRLARAEGDPTLQHVTQTAAPPGSTFKPVVAAAALARRAVDPTAVIPTGGSWSLGGHTFHNWSVLPPQDLPQAIAWSNDVYFYKLAWHLGAAALIATARRFGVGSPTGIDLPGESAGVLSTPRSVARQGGTWYPGSTVLLGIGQGALAVTPLQVTRWTAGVTTGALVVPHLGLDRSGQRRPIAAAATLGPVRAGLRAVVTSGTATDLADLPVPVSAKTGTAEDASAGGDGLDSWLTAAAPAGRPAIVVTSMIRGDGDGHPATSVARAGLAYWAAHRADLERTW